MNIPSRSLRYVRSLLAAAMLAAAATGPARAAQAIDTTVAGAAAATGAERAAIAALGFSADDPVSVAAYRAEAAQSGPYQPLDAGGYVADPAFNHGQYFEDAFFANQNSATNYFLGKKVARLDVYDAYVVASLVKNPNGNQTNGNWNIGLSYYSAAGERLCWVQPGSAYGHVPCTVPGTYNYVVYPKSDTAMYTDILGVKVIDDYIVVAANVRYDASRDYAHLLVFDKNGNLLGYTPISGSLSGYKNLYLGGMEVYNTTSGSATTPNVVVAGYTAYVSGHGDTTPQAFYRRYTLGGDGTLTQANIAALDYGACASNNCQPKGIALGFPASLTLGAPAVFVALQVPSSGNGADVSVFKLAADGSADANWHTYGWNIGGNGGDKNDVPFGIAVKSTGLGLSGSPRVHTVYVASNTSQTCAPGISVLRLSTSDNGQTGNSVIFGGSAASGVLCAGLRPPTDIGNDATMQDGKLAIAGMQVSPALISSAEDRYDGEFALVDDLSVATPLTTYPFQIGSPRSKHTGLWGIVGAGSGGFVATGDDRYPDTDDVAASLRGKQAVVTLGLAPDDVIFENGFD